MHTRMLISPKKFANDCKMDYLAFLLPFAVGLGASLLPFVFVCLFFLFSFCICTSVSSQKIASEAVLVFQRHGTPLDK